MAAMRGRLAIVITVVAVPLGACGSDDRDTTADTTAETTATTAATTTSAADPNVIAEEFDIGGGTTLYLHCRGEGSPTFLLEAGDEDNSAAWSGITRELEAETRTCAYDRAGTGRSSPATGCRGLDEIVGDLEALLEVADIEGPFIFVGSSGGGYLAAEMAARHPDETAGLATFDTFKAITSYPPGLLDELKCDAPTNIEHRDYFGVEHAVWDDRVHVGDFPMTVFTNDYGAGAQYDEIGNVEDQQGWFVLTTNATQVVVDSGHDIHFNEPDLAVTELLALLETARTG